MPREMIDRLNRCLPALFITLVILLAWVVDVVVVVVTGCFSHAKFSQLLHIRPHFLQIIKSKI